MIAVVAGGTGLVGSYLLEMLQASDSFTEVRALTRSPQPETFSKTRWIKVDLGDEQGLAAKCYGADAVFCCLGTTMKKAGSKDAFRKVDYHYVLALAGAAKRAGCTRFIVVSSVGASAGSAVFYSRVKGEMEEALRAIGFRRTIIARPGVLLGPRKEFRLGEKLGILFSRILSPMLWGGAQKYRPIHAKTVAKAMLNEALSQKPEMRILHYRELMDAAGRA